MKYRKVILSIFILLFTANFAFGQSEALKVVVNSLGFYKNTKDLNYLARAKKSIDSLIVTRKDSNNIEKLIYKGLVYTTILHEDTLNKLNQPADFFPQTAQFADMKLATHRKIRQYPAEFNFIKQCLANACIREGFRYMDKSDFVNAERYFSKARTYVPDYKALNIYLAYSNNKLGNLQTAAKFYNNLINSDSIRAEHIQAAANINMAIGDTTMALEIIKKGKKLLPGDKFLLLDEANIYNNKKDYKSLLPLLPALLNEYKTNAEVVNVAANCYDRLNIYDKAEEMYLQAIDLNGAAFDPVFNLGLLYYKKSVLDIDSASVSKDLYYATRWLEKANEILPSDVKSLQLLQQIYTQTGNVRQINKVNSKLKQLTENITYEN